MIKKLPFAKTLSFWNDYITVLKSDTSFSYARHKDLDSTEEGVGQSYSEEYGFLVAL